MGTDNEMDKNNYDNQWRTHGGGEIMTYPPPEILERSTKKVYLRYINILYQYPYWNGYLIY